MSCPECRTELTSPANSRDMFCPKCELKFYPRFDFKGFKTLKIGCSDVLNNVFYLDTDRGRFTVRQPRRKDYVPLMEALTKASEYTFLRYPSMFWEHPEGICNLPAFDRYSLGTLYLIMVIEDMVVGMSHHTYWTLDEETKQEEKLPIPVGSLICVAQLCVFDPYQNQGIGSLYAPMSEYIAMHNDADFIMGETHAKKGMVGIRLRTGWSVLSRRMVSMEDERVLIGKPLYPIPTEDIGEE